MNSVQSYDADHYGRWPIRYLLFKDLDGEGEESRRRLDIVLSWMLHFGLPSLIRESKEQRDWIHYSNVAGVIESWSWILEGLGKDTAAPEASAVMDLILERLAHHAERHQRRVIVKCWREKQRGYLALLDRLPHSERAERAKTAARRTRLIELRRRLEKFTVPSPSVELPS